MAILKDAEYPHAERIDLGPGDAFLLLTDGFVEWARSDGEQYGQERLTEVLRTNRDASSEALIHAIHRDVLAFSLGTAQADDLTAVILRRTAD